MNNSRKFQINPLVGTDLVVFGMSAQEVERALGPPDQVSKNALGSRVEFRAAMNVGYATAPQLVDHIGFGRQMEQVYFGELNVFAAPPAQVLKALIAADPRPLTYLGFVVFLHLGIALTGFHDDDEFQKAATLFPKGAWDKRVEKMRPFSMAE